MKMTLKRKKMMSLKRKLIVQKALNSRKTSEPVLPTLRMFHIPPYKMILLIKNSQKEKKNFGFL